MTTHLKLEHGDIITVATENEASRTVTGITGRIIGIIDGEQEKTCFIFRNGDDLIRFYLDRDAKPATRLLILLCSRLNLLKDSVVFIRSVKGFRPGQSRLNLNFIDEDIDGEAPYVLPCGASRQNTQRIELVRAALELVEAESETSSADGEESGDTREQASETVRSTVGDLSEHAPVIVGGLDSADVSVSRLDARRVALVHGYPLFAIVYENAGDEDTHEGSGPKIVGNLADIAREICEDTTVIRRISRNFITEAERTAFVSGLEEGATNVPYRYIFKVTRREDVNDCLQEIARLI